MINAGYNKYFTMSYDDGPEQDKKLIGLLKKFGLKSTFNLNSGLFGNRNSIIRAGEIGFASVKNGDRFPVNLFDTVDCRIIPADEIAQVYEGCEIASHGRTHKLLPFCNREKLKYEIVYDADTLTAAAGYKIAGHAYPYGRYNKAVIRCLQDSGIFYARTVKSTRSFDFPSNPYLFHPTCWSGDKHVFEILDRFISAEPVGRDMLFCLWGHSYEFDYGTDRCSWTRMESICEKISGRDDIVYCSSREAFSRFKEQF